MTAPESHPRYASLVARDALVEGVEAGYVAPQGLTAHGRGEAFDYLIGEVTTEPARRAIEAAAAALVAAERPVLSVNGNVAALVPGAVAELQAALGERCRVEVNLFHRTEARVAALVARLEAHGCRAVLGTEPDARIPGIDSARAQCSEAGIFGADVVLVPLEDGDRCEALVAMGKTVVTVDLNPLSRTARKATITIVDNVVRAVPALKHAVAERAGGGPQTAGRRPRTGTDRGSGGANDEGAPFDNAGNLGATLGLIRDRLGALAAEPAGLGAL